jgi:DNA-binding GntR family transcriptional regulator
MNEDTFNVSIRQFLKTLGVTTQREIEKAVRQAIEDGKLKGNERLSAKATVTIAGISLTHEINGNIALE